MAQDSKKLNLSLIGQFTESRQYRSKQEFKKTDARKVADQVFLDLIALWILSNEEESAAKAANYAGRTSTYNSFRNFRQMATDLYLNLHVIAEDRLDLIGDSPENSNLLSRLHINDREIVRFLRGIQNGNLSAPVVRQILQRLEQSLAIEDSNYRSIRRLAQNWPELTPGQKRLVMTRLIYFYRANARRSELFYTVSEMAKNQNLYDPSAKDPELWKKTLAGAAAFGVGYAAGHRFGSWISKKSK